VISFGWGTGTNGQLGEGKGRSEPLGSAKAEEWGKTDLVRILGYKHADNRNEDPRLEGFWGKTKKSLLKGRKRREINSDFGLTRETQKCVLPGGVREKLTEEIREDGLRRGDRKDWKPQES